MGCFKDRADEILEWIVGHFIEILMPFIEIETTRKE